MEPAPQPPAEPGSQPPAEPGSQSPAEPASPPPASADPKSRETSARLNPVVITIDTLRADHLGGYGYFRDTSPTIDALARDSILFARCLVPVALGPVQVTLGPVQTPVEGVHQRGPHGPPVHQPDTALAQPAGPVGPLVRSVRS